MTNVQIAACLYILGMFVTIYHDVISSERGLKIIREQIYNDTSFSKQTKCAIIVIACLLASAVWPYCWCVDVTKFLFKKRS